MTKQNTRLPKISAPVQFGGEILTPLSSDGSIQTFLILPQFQIRRVCVELSEYKGANNSPLIRSRLVIFGKRAFFVMHFPKI